MKLFRIFQGSLIRRLALLFLILGFIPATLFTIVPTTIQSRSSQKAADEVRLALEKHAEEELRQLAETHALRYNMVFEAKAEIAKTLANYITDIMGTPSVIGFQTSDYFGNRLEKHDEGWMSLEPDSPIGFMASPLMKHTDDIFERQNTLSKSSQLLESVVDANSLIRSVFIITEDQTIWMYPNLFWVGGVFNEPKIQDFTARPYYGDGSDIVWTNPYVDREPVITVASPIRSEGKFYGMVGIDFSIETIVDDILQTEIGEGGYMFLVSQDAKLINMPERARTSILSGEFAASAEKTFGKTLLEVVSVPVREQFQTFRLTDQLQERKTFVQTIDTSQGVDYFAFAPMPNMPWYVVLVMPINESLQVASDLENTLKSTNQTLFIMAIITAFGFFAVILIGGIINLQRLAFPIQELADGAEKIRHGELSYRVPVPKGEHEMTDLTKTFNAMVESVQSTVRDRAVEYDSINRIAELANKQGKLSTLLNDALSIAQHAVGLDILALTLMDENGGNKLMAVACEDRIRKDLYVHFDSGVEAMSLMDVVTSHQPLMIPDVYSAKVQMDNQRLEGYRKLGVHQVYMLPILSKGKELGVVILMQCSEEEIPPHKLSYLDAIFKHIGVLVENLQLQRQNRDLIIVDERCRLASDLHDSVTQSLFTISLMAEGLKVACCDKEKISPALELLQNQIEFVQKEMRTLINELRPLNTKEENLSRILQIRANTFQRATGIETSMRMSGDPHDLSGAIQENLYKIAQEALNNIAKHAKASKVEVALDVDDEMVTMTISDDGVGFDPVQVTLEKTSSFGLLSMRERAEMMDGILLVRSQIGKGTMIVTKVPLAGNSMEVSLE